MEDELWYERQICKICYDHGTICKHCNICEACNTSCDYCIAAHSIKEDTMTLQSVLQRTATSSEKFWEYKFNTAKESFSGWFPTNASARRVAESFPEVLSITNPNDRIIYTKV